MRLGLGLGLPYVAANQHLTAGGGSESLLYGLSNDGPSEWGAGEPVGVDEDALWTATPAYLLNAETLLWEAV